MIADLYRLRVKRQLDDLLDQPSGRASSIAFYSYLCDRLAEVGLDDQVALDQTERAFLASIIAPGDSSKMSAFLSILHRVANQ